MGRRLVGEHSAIGTDLKERYARSESITTQCQTRESQDDNEHWLATKVRVILPLGAAQVQRAKSSKFIEDPSIVP
jgi:hypothetical protein